MAVRCACSHLCQHHPATTSIPFQPALDEVDLVLGHLDTFFGQGGHHVHLSKDIETARKVGSRCGKPVILQVEAGKMHGAGLRFFLSVNGVWLTDAVPAAFLARM